jgi:predicted transcriptional regulator
MERKTLRNRDEALRDEMVRRNEIMSLLQQGPKTIPEMAAQLGYPSHELVQWIMAMRRYGLVEELPKNRAEDYYQYQLAEKG